MTHHDPQVILRQMLTYAREAQTLCAGKTHADLDADRILELALTRLLEIIGEAANRAPSDVQTRNPNIPWSQIISLRNRLIHGYDAVDLDILWQIIHHDLPPLISALETLVK